MKPQHKALLLSLFTIAVLSTLPAAHAQSAPASATAPAPSTAPAYDVMTIKLDKSLSQSISISGGADRFSATNVSLREILANAYDFRPDLVTGISNPIESARFDIEAKLSDPDPAALKAMSPDQKRRMILPLLIERFQLKTHIETKTLPVFELVVASGGPKFKPSADQTQGGDGSVSINGSRTGLVLTAQDMPMYSLAKRLTMPVRRTVIDKTHLTGHYDLTLQWSTDDSPDAPADASPVIFTALPEQLGLKLQPAKGPVETLVVDHAELPSDN